jgi:hypothetical protein
MATKKFMGRNSLVDRLSAQVGDEKLARAILTKRGDMKQGRLTATGRARDKMTAEERAKDRASKASGKSAKAYKYNPNTNLATLKKD